MRSLIGLAYVSVALIAASGPGFAQAPEPASALAAWADAYAAQDGPRSAATYTEDATLWGTASRAPTVGIAGIADYFGRRREGVASVSVTFDEQAVQSLSGAAAVAYGRYTFRQKRTDGSETSLPARFTMTLVKAGDGSWRIAHHHSSPMPRP